MYNLIICSRDVISYGFRAHTKLGLARGWYLGKDMQGPPEERAGASWLGLAGCDTGREPTAVAGVG